VKFLTALCHPGIVQLATDQAQQRRLNFSVGQLRAARDKAHNRRGHFFGDQFLPGRNTAASACVPVIGASRSRFCAMLGIEVFRLSSGAR